jgi:predicted ATPase
MSRSSLKRRSTLKAPFLKQLSFDVSPVKDDALYPFSIPLFKKSFSLAFTKPITIFVGENGTGKSTLLEFIAHACGFNIWGGSRNHFYGANENQSLDYLNQLTKFMRLSWLPRVSKGFFMRAETFFNFLEKVHYGLDGYDPAFLEQCYGGDLFKRSHGESFLAFFEHQMDREGIFLFDEPESALSPSRQVEFLKLLKRVENSQRGQVIMVTHSPLLMAFPGADLFSFTHCGIEQVQLKQIENFQLLEKFFNHPHQFIKEIMSQKLDKNLNNEEA